MKRSTFFRGGVLLAVPFALLVWALTAMGVIFDPHATFPHEARGVFSEALTSQRVSEGVQLSWAVEDECTEGGYTYVSQSSIGAYEDLEDVDWGGGKAECVFDGTQTRCSEVLLNEYFDKNQPYSVQVNNTNCVKNIEGIQSPVAMIP